MNKVDRLMNSKEVDIKRQKKFEKQEYDKQKREELRESKNIQENVEKASKNLQKMIKESKNFHNYLKRIRSVYGDNKGNVILFKGYYGSDTCMEERMSVNCFLILNRIFFLHTYRDAKFWESGLYKINLSNFPEDSRREAENILDKLQDPEKTIEFLFEKFPSISRE